MYQESAERCGPGYHGGTSGLLKNALDYLQELAVDPVP
jgi:NAD(P)H-dependent FMN reductase